MRIKIAVHVLQFLSYDDNAHFQINVIFIEKSGVEGTQNCKRKLQNHQSY